MSAKSQTEPADGKRVPAEGSIERKAALLKACFGKMALGAVMISPVVVTLLSHKWGQPGSGLLFFIFFPLSAVLFVLACTDYAKSKGLHPAVGLLGLCSIFGLIILSVWPDRYKYNAEAKRERKKAGRR